MNRLPSILILLCAASAFGAITPSNCSIEASGFVVDVDMSNSDAGGDFSLGFATNNSGVSKVVLTVSSPGYDDTGGAITIVRTVYGTKQLRKPYPNNASADIGISGSTATVKFVLSDYVFSSDTATASIAANTYSNNVAQTGLSVTVNSTATHPKCIANWSYPGLRMITSSTLTLRAVGFHQSARAGRPLRVMRFVARDQSGNAVTNFVTQMTIDSTMPDACKVSEYVASVNVSTLAQGDLIRCDFTAYPWVGDPSAIQDTMDGVNLMGPGYAPQTNRLDRTGAYGSSYAIVATNGTASGLVSSNNNRTWIAPFDTITHAVNAIVQSNAIWFGASRSNAANSTVYTSTGDIAWHGATDPFFGNPFPIPALEVTAWPTNARNESFLITGASYTDARHFNWKISNLTCRFTGLAFSSANYNSLWVDNCCINSSSAQIWTRATNNYITHCTISNMVGGTLASGQAPTLIRGNSFFNTNNCGLRTYTTIGNRRFVNMVDALTGALANTDGLVPYPDRPICAYNEFYGINDSSSAIQFFTASNCTNGGAFVQNIVENTNSASGGFRFLFAASANSTYSTNILIWNNTLVGESMLLAYNDTGTTPMYRILYSFKNNACDYVAIKSDTFGTPNANRVGNWPVLFGVGCKGNAIPGTTNPGSYFDFEFAGLDCFQQDLNGANWFDFVDLEGCNLFINPRLGFGNYRLKSSSPSLVSLKTEWLLPFDIEGVPRGGFDPPGAYASASPRKGGAFFGF